MNRPTKMLRGLFQLSALIVIALGYAIIALADSEVMPRPTVFVSPGGSYYFRLIPSADFDAQKAEGFLYRVADDADELLYQTKGWYSFNVFVSSDGRYIARSGPWPRYDSRPEDTPAIVFYEDGQEVRTYCVSDLIADESKLEFSVSHYSWGGAVRWSEDGWSGRIEVETVEDKTITFDIQTAEIVQ